MIAKISSMAVKFVPIVNSWNKGMKTTSLLCAGCSAVYMASFEKINFNIGTKTLKINNRIVHGVIGWICGYYATPLVIYGMPFYIYYAIN